MEPCSTRLLIVTDTQEDDKLGAALARSLREDSKGRLDIQGYSLHGDGQAFRNVNISFQQPAGPGRFNMLELTRRRPVEWCVSIGRLRTLTLCYGLLGCPNVYVPTHVTARARGIRPIEGLLAARWSRLVFPRDAQTAKILRGHGVKALYIGNLMSDLIHVTEAHLGGIGDTAAVALLPDRPGQRREIQRLIMTAERISAFIWDKMVFFLDIGEGLDTYSLRMIGAEMGWEWRAPSADECVGGVHGVLERNKMVIRAVKGRLGDVLNMADAAVATPGAIAELASGAGVPTVVLRDVLDKVSRRRAKLLHRLVGEAAIATETPPQAAEAVWDVLTDPDRYEKMQRTGREQMGKPQVAQRMSRIIVPLVLGRHRKEASSKAGS